MITTDALESAELAVLGLVLVTSGQIIDDIDLSPDDFYEPKRADLYALMVSMWGQGHPVDAFTLADANPDETAFLYSLTSTTATPSSAPYYADIIRRHALRRRLAIAGAQLGAIDATSDAAAVADDARRILDDAIRDAGNRVRFVGDILPEVIERMESKHVFTPSPWETLNTRIGGFRPGAVYVVAARPGVGKTVVAAQIATCLADHGNVAFASLEMTGEELVARLVSERLRINVGKIKNARMESPDWAKFAAGRADVESLRVAIDDRSGVSASDVRGFARSVARRGPLAGVVVDYMQLMVSKQRMDRHLQVADFSRQLKIMAKDMRVPVVALSQLNRNSESSAVAVPKLSDLRESGAIEQDADVVMLLRREGEFPSESLVIDVAKNRHGETGEVRLHWDGGYSRVVEWDHRDDRAFSDGTR